MPRLMSYYFLRKLATEGLVLTLDPEVPPEQDEEDTEIIEKYANYKNSEVCGIFDEDTYDDGAPFAIIAKKMDNLLPDGKIKKRVLRKGEGEPPQEYAAVTVHYNVYLEYHDEPFDSTYARNKAYKFRLNDGRVVAGLDFAVQTMLLNEKSQFLVDPEYAYGKHSIGKIPSNSTVLFEVELLKIVNSGAAMMYDSLPEEQQQTFEEIYKYCSALCEEGKQFFVEGKLKSAIKEYNTAGCRWKEVVVKDPTQIHQYRELWMKIFSNLLVCYTKQGEPRKGCANAKNIYQFTEDGDLMKIPIKIYFNHAKCLRLLGEYSEARTVLEKARQVEPNNMEIAKELITLEKEKKELTETRKAFAKALVSGE